jgi:DNA-directed RNA polymerase subunit RPC12/RpoP
MPQETLGYVKLEWTCPKCGGRNPGTEKTCTSCGAPQPQDLQFEQTEGQQISQDEALKEIAEAGPDIHCAFCGTRNPASAAVCLQCGADLKEGARRQAGKVVGAYKTGPAKEVACPTCGTMNPETALRCAQCGASMAREPQASAAPSAAKPAARPNWVIYAVLAVLVICLCAGSAYLLSRSMARQEFTGVVQNVAWQTSVAIQELGPVQRQGWQDQIPADAQIGNCEDQVRSVQESEPAGEKYNKVCGTPYTVDTGSGVGKVVQDCQFEVLAPYCEYTLQEWRVVNQAVERGNNYSPIFPEPQLSSNQRLGEESVSYVVIFQTDQGEYEYTVNSLEEFQQFRLDSRWILTLNGFNQIVGLEPDE